MSEQSSRRAFLNRTMMTAAGVGAYAFEERRLKAAVEDAPAKQPASTTAKSKGLPCGKIGNVSISRLFMGGNLIGGWAHSRDLLYVSKLFKSYNNEAKIIETLALAEQHGINTLLIDPRDWDPVLKYKKEHGGKIQTLVCITPDADTGKMRDEVKQLVDRGANLLYTHGEVTDRMTMSGRVDVLAKAMELIKAQGVPGGIGSHSLETPMACEKNHVGNDFYVKTFHHDRYWSATPRENREEWCWYRGMQPDHDKFHDNMWCLDPEKTASFMETVQKPWIAFKVMAAGAIPPQMAFPNAYRNGADFIVAGMFDFHVEQDVQIATDALQKLSNRKRPWYG